MKIDLKTVACVVASIVLCQLAGIIGAVFTMPAIPAWYASLDKPFFTPPGWAFGPVWITLYTLMGISVFLVWRDGINKKNKKALGVFGAQLAFNALWSFAFFGLQSPLAGLAVIVPLWLLIVLSILEFQKLSKPAAYLLAPYLLWVSVATALNAMVWLLNA